MSDTLQVERREETGSGRIRRLRQRGLIPAILYGHGEANVCLSATKAAVWSVVKHGGKLVALTGAVTENALVRAVQWDPMGDEVIHLDLLRVSASDTVETSVTIELKGTAPGLTEGGILQFVMHELAIECPAMSIPDKLVVSVNDLHLGKAIHAREVTLPEGAKLAVDGDLVVVQVVAPKSDDEGAPGAEGSGVEPELIRKEKAAEEAKEG